MIFLLCSYDLDHDLFVVMIWTVICLVCGLTSQLTAMVMLVDLTTLIFLGKLRLSP